jgi:hypothetical protein
MKKIKLVLKIILLSALFAFVSYIFYKIDFSKIKSFWDLVNQGYPETKKVILSSEIFNKIPMAPVFIIWGTIGTIAYLFYYSLELFYNNIRNWIVIKYFYTHPRTRQAGNKKFIIRRIIIHIGVIAVYLLFVLSVILVAVPVGSLFFSKFNYLSQMINNNYIQFTARFILSTLFWTLFFGFYSGLIYLANMIMKDETIEHEHGFEDLEGLK